MVEVKGLHHLWIRLNKFPAADTYCIPDDGMENKRHGLLMARNVAPAFIEQLQS
jgi:hypothetical protein